VDYVDSYSFLHFGVRGLTEQRAFVTQANATADPTMIPAMGMVGSGGGQPPRSNGGGGGGGGSARLQGGL